jgi:hypothetical protein
VQLGGRWQLGLYLVFAVVGLVVYSPALSGDFISDDQHYVQNNPYVHTLNFDNLIAIWDPTSVVTILVENYAPVHLVLHGLEYQVFGQNVTGYHVVNVLLHALAALMLVEVYRRSGIAMGAGILGAGVFLLHPANVESVAWISQLKSSSALVLSLAALLLHPRRPLLAVVFFALALFAKPFAAFALIVVALFGWVRATPSPDDSTADTATPRESYRWPWLLGWIGTVVLFGVIEAFAFSHSAGQVPALYADLVTRFLTIFSIALRYLWMAVSGLGLSTFHEPPPVESVLDPWLIGSLVVLALLGWRLVICLRGRREEAVYWLWAVISFGPLSGVVPLPYPMADRYLYFVLPGLIGASLLAADEGITRLGERLGGGEARKLQLRQIAVGASVLLLVHFAAASYSRASVFRSAEGLMADAERNYPDGAAANTRKASRAARMGDFPSAVRHLKLAHARGYNRLDHLLQDPNYGPMQDYPEFVELKHAMADDWIGRLGGKPNPSQVEARAIAQAYIVKDDLPAALRAIEAGIAVPGPITDDLRGDADMLRREIARRDRLRRASPR